MNPAVDDLPARLREKITVRADGCWEWVGYLEDGYGRVHFLGGPRLAHRVVWALLVGEPPEVLHHTCPRRACVNPAHLEPTTHTDHPDSAPRWQAAKTHCPHGHRYSERDWTYRSNGRQQRNCRACNRERERARYARRKEGR